MLLFLSNFNKHSVHLIPNYIFTLSRLYKYTQHSSLSKYKSCTLLRCKYKHNHPLIYKVIYIKLIYSYVSHYLFDICSFALFFNVFLITRNTSYVFLDIVCCCYTQYLQTNLFSPTLIVVLCLFLHHIPCMCAHTLLKMKQSADVNMWKNLCF